MLGAARPVVLSSGVSSICGARAAPAAAHAPAKAAVSMTGDYGITLQTLLYEPNPVVSSVSDKDVMVRLIYRQVFGNAYVMEEEIADVYKAQSMYRAGLITVKDFVRAIALSETYRRRFFTCCGPFRAVELNFKHLLGRGPTSKEEISEHVRRTIEEGYEADVNSFIDSVEYDQRFGTDYIPGITFKGTYTSSLDFNNMCSIYSSPGTTDKSLTIRAKTQSTPNSNQVLSLDGAGIPSKLAATAAGQSSAFTRVKAALPLRPDLDLGVEVGQSLIKPYSPSTNDQTTPAKKRVEISMGNYMYLTAEEAAVYNFNTVQETRAVRDTKSEAKAAKAEIARLQAKIANLSAVL